MARSKFLPSKSVRVPGRHRMVILTLGVTIVSLTTAAGESLSAERSGRTLFRGNSLREARGGMPDAARPGFAEMGAPRPAFVRREVVVQLDPAAPAIRRLPFLQARTVERTWSMGRHDYTLLRLQHGETVRAAVRRLSRNPSVLAAEPNYLYEATAAPNDPLFSKLWALSNVGQTVEGAAGLPDADIDALEAWDLTKGSADVRVAVVDSGVAVGHPDLAPNVLGGWDFVDGDAVPEDRHGHGTHVAATIGARGNDGFGVAGVAWNVGIIPVRVLDAEGLGSVSDIVAGVEFAARQGADVINLSLGGPNHSQIFANAMASHPNVLFVVAAGNGGEDGVGDDNDTVPDFPCSYTLPNIVCVAASDQSDRLAGFSNRGARSVDLAAPGTRILSAVSVPESAFSSGFEEASLPWTSDGTTPWSLVEDSFGMYASDSPFGSYDNETDSWLDSALFSLGGRRGCILNFWMYLDTELDYDHLLVEATTDGLDYTTVTGWSGWSEDWIPLSVSLSAYDGQPRVGISFRLVSDEDVIGDGAEIDDVSVDCAGSAFGSNSFVVMEGTSMAAPHVSGAAALLLAYRPTATLAELRDALLRGVDAKTALAGKVATGGRLNVFNSLRLLTPPETPAPTASPVPTTTPTPPPVATPPPSATPQPTGSPTPQPTAPSDTTAPLLTLVRDVPDPFSPDGDGVKDRTKISWTSDEQAATNVSIYKKSGIRVRNFGTHSLEEGSWFIRWNGKTGTGKAVKPGTYYYEIMATDEAGNTSITEGTVTVAS